LRINSGEKTVEKKDREKNLKERIIKRLKRENEELADKLKVQKIKITDLNREIINLNKANLKLEGTLEITQDRLTEIEEEKLFLEKSIKEQKSLLKLKEEEIATLKEEKVDLKERIVFLRNKLADSSSGSLTAEIKDLEKIRKNLLEEDKLKREEILRLKANIQEKEQIISAGEREIESLKEEKADLKEKIVFLRNKLADSSSGSLTAEIKDLEKIRKNLLEEDKLKREEVLRLKADIQEKEQIISAGEREIESLKGEKVDLKGKIVVLQNKHQGRETEFLNSEIQKLQEEKEKLAEENIFKEEKIEELSLKVEALNKVGASELSLEDKEDKERALKIIKEYEEQIKQLNENYLNNKMRLEKKITILQETIGLLKKEKDALKEKNKELNIKLSLREAENL
jgi:chromosome segregation ATPase